MGIPLLNQALLDLKTNNTFLHPEDVVVFSPPQSHPPLKRLTWPARLYVNWLNQHNQAYCLGLRQLAQTQEGKKLFTLINPEEGDDWFKNVRWQEFKNAVSTGDVLCEWPPILSPAFTASTVANALPSLTTTPAANLVPPLGAKKFRKEKNAK